MNCMAFRARMETNIQGFSVIGGPRTRIWNGVVADLWDVKCGARAGGYYVGKDPRFVFMLDVKGDENSRYLMDAGSKKAQQLSEQPKISYVPTDMELWAEFRGVKSVQHLDLHFDVATLSARLMQDLDTVALSNPRLMFHDEKLLSIARLIAAECDNPDPLHNLYGESLVLALLTDFLKISNKAQKKRSQLASWQLRAATDYIRENCLRSIRLQELAELTNLSQSHFSHAFKASTGLPPHQWQMQERIGKVKELLLEKRMPLTDVAVTAGFSDQAHFSRVFRKIVGVTPSVWQRGQA